MALGIYVGALTFFWDGVWALDPGTSPTIFYGETARRQELEDRRQVVQSWRAKIKEELGSRLSGPLEWDETIGEYAAVWPFHRGMQALRVWAGNVGGLKNASQPLATLEVDLDTIDFDETEISPRFDQIMGHVDYWLPSPFDFVFDFAGPEGEFARIGSTMSLLKQLEDLNRVTWKAAQAEIVSWSEIEDDSRTSFDLEAKYGFSHLLQGAQYACSNRMPMIRDDE